MEVSRGEARSFIEAAQPLFAPGPLKSIITSHQRPRPRLSVSTCSYLSVPPHLLQALVSSSHPLPALTLTCIYAPSSPQPAPTSPPPTPNLQVIHRLAIACHHQQLTTFTFCHQKHLHLLLDLHIMTPLICTTTTCLTHSYLQHIHLSLHSAHLPIGISCEATCSLLPCKP